MSLNASEIDLILDELALPGNFIQDVEQPNFSSLVFHCYKNGKRLPLFICTANNACRIHETKQKIPKNKTPLRFMELLKARIKGAKIISASHLAHDRIIALKLLKSECDSKTENVSKNETVFLLYIRLWSNAANVVLCDGENRIIDCLYRRPKKNEITGAYFFPPEKENSKKRKIREFPQNDTRSFNEKIDELYCTNETSLSLLSLRKKCEAQHKNAREKKILSLHNLQSKKKDFLHAEKYKQYGDAILENAHRMKQGEKFLQIKNFFVSLDTKKNPYENAETYYALFKKAKHGLNALNADIEILENEIKALDEQYEKMQNEKNPIALEQFLREKNNPTQRQKKTRTGLEYEIAGWTILVGRDANENDELLRHNVFGNDMWLHARDFSGGYVFIKNKTGAVIPPSVLSDAANLALYFSKARKSGKGDVYCTEVKYLRRIKNAKKGTVSATHEKNIFRTIDAKRIDELHAQNKRE